MTIEGHALISIAEELEPNLRHLRLLLASVPDLDIANRQAVSSVTAGLHKVNDAVTLLRRSLMDAGVTADDAKSAIAGDLENLSKAEQELAALENKLGMSATPVAPPAELPKEPGV